MNGSATGGATLHLLTGPWASGKSSLVPYLTTSLPGVVVFDWDVLLPGLSEAVDKDASREPSTWGGLQVMWTAIVESVLTGAHDVLLCGPAGTAEFTRTGRFAYPIRCAYLDCPEDVLRERLLLRGAADEEVADELAVMAALRRSTCTPVVAGERALHRIAEDVVRWVEEGCDLPRP